MTSPNQIIDAFMSHIETPVSDKTYMSFSYRQLIRYFLEWLTKHKLLNVEQLKKDIKLTTGE